MNNNVSSPYNLVFQVIHILHIDTNQLDIYTFIFCAALQAKMARKTSAVKGHDTNTSNPAILGGSLPSALHSTCATTLC